MMKRRRYRLTQKLRFIALLAVLLCVSLGIWFAVDRDSMSYFFTPTRDNITLTDDGFATMTIDGLALKAKTVGGALVMLNVSLGEHDTVTPSPDQQLTSGARITVTRAHRIIIAVDAEEKELYTHKKNIGDALSDAGVVLGASDTSSLSLDDRIRDGIRTEITRVSSTEELITKVIPFTKITQKDDQKDIGTKEVTQKGIDGEKEVTYTITLHNGQEQERVVAGEKIVTESTDEITVVGTREAPKVVKTGKSHKGQASWYAHKGCDCAANPWLPFGSYVKVTNRANGKSVVVRINDRGPFVPGRIVDLDKSAFKKIASIGAGVIDVKMEEVKE